VGEFLVLLASFYKYKIVGGLAVIGAILAAAYMLRLVQKMVWADSDGHMHHGENSHHLFDLNFRETATLAFLTVFVFWIGLNPEPFLKVMDTSTTHLLEQLESGMKVLPAGHGESHAFLGGVGESIKHVLALK
jgi:NADH-quinone oxidoreductase subunit M